MTNHCHHIVGVSSTNELLLKADKVEEIIAKIQMHRLEEYGLSKRINEHMFKIIFSNIIYSKDIHFDDLYKKSQMNLSGL